MRHSLTILALVTALSAQGAVAQPQHNHHHGYHAHDEHQTRQLGAHVHGISRLDVVLEGPLLAIELTSPAADIVGFEYAPRSEGESAAVAQAQALLEQGMDLFTLPAAARCRQSEVRVHSPLLNASPHAGHAHHRQHAHARHDDPVHGGHDRHAHHGHHDHAGDHAHADFVASYLFECERPNALDAVEVNLFTLFPGAEAADVQLVTPARQSATRLTRGASRLRF